MIFTVLHSTSKLQAEMLGTVLQIVVGVDRTISVQREYVVRLEVENAAGAKEICRHAATLLFAAGATKTETKAKELS